MVGQDDQPPSRIVVMLGEVESALRAATVRILAYFLPETGLATSASALVSIRGQPSVVVWVTTHAHLPGGTVDGAASAP